MLFLLFQLGVDHYVLSAEDVIEVLPLVALKHLPHPPRGIVGLLNYRGQPVPVLDLSLFVLGQSSVHRISTRLLITRWEMPGYGARPAQKLLGIIVEHATETINKDPADFQLAGVVSMGAPYFGPVAQDLRGFIQRIELTALLNEELRAALLDSPAFAEIQQIEFTALLDGGFRPALSNSTGPAEGN